MGRAGRGTELLGGQVACLELRLSEVIPPALVAELKSPFLLQIPHLSVSKLGSATVCQQHIKVTFGCLLCHCPGSADTVGKKMNSLPHEAYLQSGETIINKYVERGGVYGEKERWL